MRPKFIEIRDRATCIPALAFYINRDDGPIARRAGFGEVGCVYLVALATEKAAYDPYSGVWGSARTMRVVHQWLSDYNEDSGEKRLNFDAIRDGQVVDARVILGEATEPAVAECV